MVDYFFISGIVFVTTFISPLILKRATLTVPQHFSLYILLFFDFVLLCVFSCFLFEKYKENYSLILIFFKRAKTLIKNKSKQDLEKEIEDLIKNNAFIQHYLDLYKNKPQCFNKTFSNLLKELNDFHKCFNKDKDKNFIKEFNNLEDNCSFIAFLIYLNNCYLLMNNEKYLNYQKMKNGTTQIQQLEHLKENLLPSFNVNGTGFVKSIDFLKIK